MRKITKPNRVVKTADHVFDILDALRDADTVTLSDLSQQVDLAQSTIHDYLATLEYNGYVVQEDGEYKLGLRLLDYGITAREQRPLASFAKPALERLADETEEGVRLWCEVNGLAYILDRVLGEKAVQLHPYDRPGSSTYLHSHSGGKAILAWLPEEYVEEIIDRYGLPKQAHRTIIDREELFEELATIRDRGVAFSVGESFKGAHSVAAPIIVDEVVGSISVAGPGNRLQGEFFEDELPDLILGATNEIELQMAHSSGT